MAYAQSVRLVHAAGQNDVAERSRPRLGIVGIGAVQADFDAGAAYVDAGGDAGHFVVEIGMVGMQHQHRAEQLDRRESSSAWIVLAPSTCRRKVSAGAISVTRRLTPMPRGSERPKS